MSQLSAQKQHGGAGAAVPQEIVHCAGVGVQVPGAWLVREVNCTLSTGSLTALVGPNGAGKSTLLSVLAGDRRPDAGQVRVAGRSPADWPSRPLARVRAVMRQSQQLVFAFSVGEVAAMGRMPHPEDPELDRRIVGEALAAADVAHLADRDVTTLSGGEAARAAFARTLAQTTPLVLLDEPTAALDLRHQEAVLGVAAALRDAGCCVVVVLHDLKLAARYADRVLVFDAGRLVADGAPRQVLTAELIERVYRQPVQVLRQPGTDLPLIVALPTAAGIGPASRSVLKAL